MALYFLHHLGVAHLQLHDPLVMHSCFEGLLVNFHADEIHRGLSGLGGICVLWPPGRRIPPAQASAQTSTCRIEEAALQIPKRQSDHTAFLPETHPQPE